MEKPFPALLQEKLQPLIHIKDDSGQPPPPGFHPVDETTLAFLKKLNLYLTLKIHRNAGETVVGMGIRHVHDDNAMERISVSDDFKKELQEFFRNHNQDPSQKHNALVYHHLYKIASEYLEDNNEPDLTLWKRAITLGPDKKESAGQDRIPSQVVETLDMDKPLVIYCGGVLDFSEKKGFMDRALERIERLLYAADLPPDDYNLFGITYQNTSALRKTSVIHGYNSMPDKFYSRQAKVFVSKLLMPQMVKEGEGGQVEKEDTETIKRRFSNITFFAYSYGTIFVHEVENALRETMSAPTAAYTAKDGSTREVQMGYTVDEIRDVLSALRAVSVGNTANLVDKDHLGVIPSIATTAKDDMVSQARSDNEAHLAHDPVRALRHARVGSNLLLEAESVGTKAPAMRFVDTGRGRSITQIIDEEVERLGPDAPIFENNGHGGRKGNLTSTAYPMATVETSHNIAQGHHPVAYMRSNRIREDGEFTFQTHPGAEAVKVFFRESLNESRRTRATGEIRGDGKALLDRIQAEHLTPDAIGETVLKMKYGRQTFDAFGKDQVDPALRR